MKEDESTSDDMMEHQQVKKQGKKKSYKNKIMKEDESTSDDIDGASTGKKQGNLQENSGQKKRKCNFKQGEFEEDEGNMGWGRKTLLVKLKLEAYEKKLKNSLAAAKKYDPEHYKFKWNNMSMWKALDDYARKKDGDFMCYDMFNKWMTGKRKVALRPVWANLLDIFSEEFDGCLDKDKKMSENLEENKRKTIFQKNLMGTQMKTRK
eukprot:CAMPEP_0196194012 /NCGR_PEP_ID=MMETSP0911-20130528/49839_1 /TAXON_ID=49265 /ORGANISM="Thalassiosira rotula, Strain GSO102" /LENGTH=206 /DNA_ID=CAMNT_0041466269 /DNA_START=389 /DNA_END=1010 /DNA_ORIENTATION=-